MTWTKSIAACALAGMTLFSTSALGEEFGYISVSISDNVQLFEIDSAFALTASDWVGPAHLDRTIEMTGYAADGPWIVVAVEHEQDGTPSIFVRLTGADGSVSTGDASGGMSVVIEQYDILPPAEGEIKGEAAISGRYAGPLRDDAGQMTSVQGTFNAQVPRLTLFVALPE